ncbi:MAG: fumarate hydratase [Candidatus Tectomicrobia bacterium]|uniref:Fumarate hydratase n=1 Tax=Tectimicrobiota bacterium TaxID=2528274 RepID=A0A932CLB0_UNCTE|nr:fumarate hydratase [Candidatus Tectomicrobia bacterium]
MKTIHVSQIIEAVKSLCMEANYDLGEDVLAAFDRGLATEESPTGSAILRELKENAQIAREEHVPICQDTGLAVAFVELGQEVHIAGGLLKEAIEEGVRQGYREGYLRKSVCDPFTRKNTGDNTPAILHLELVTGDEIRIQLAPKGGGSENMSRLAMLKPSDGLEGIKRFVVQTASEAGPNPCPPVVVGVGIGGNFEVAALLSKKALLRPLGSVNPNPEMAAVEKELMEKINALGMGPQGLGGRTYALGVHIEVRPCHIASLPVAVNINCHASRHKEVTL